MAAGGAERFRDGGFQVDPTSYSDARRLVIQWQTYGMKPNINVKWEQLIRAIDVYYGSRVNNIMFHDGEDGSTGNIKSPEDWGMEWSNEAMNVIELFQAWSSRQAVSGVVDVSAGAEELVSPTQAPSMLSTPKRKRKRLNLTPEDFLLTPTSA